MATCQGYNRIHLTNASGTQTTCEQSAWDAFLESSAGCAGDKTCCDGLYGLYLSAVGSCLANP